MNETDLLPVMKAAKRLGIAPTTLRMAIQRGELPAFRQPLDRRIRLVRIADVDALVNARPVEEKGATPVGR